MAIDESFISRLEDVEASVRALLAKWPATHSAPPRPEPPTRACPCCGKAMRAGRASIHGTPWGYFLVGRSYQHLWFEDAAGSESVILRSGRSQTAYRCDGCGFLGLPGERSQSLAAPDAHM